MSGYLLGYDVGSSSVKATLLDTATGKAVASASSPDRELDIIAAQPGWAEQEPAVWWKHLVHATAKLREKAEHAFADVAAVGISYQMHGLVLLDERRKVVRPAIIWCDSRAVEIGHTAFAALGEETCLRRLLNSPGNFTASKLRWVIENEPENFARARTMMLPGDYIAFRMTGEINTTASSLSEGILWDYAEQCPADLILDHYGIPREMVPEVVPTFAVHGCLSTDAAKELGLHEGIPLAYRAGDQPNNALSLNVLQPGELAATAGTSGVVCGIGNEANYDRQSRVNTFIHVNHTVETPRYATLLCVNGTGILNSWLRHNLMTLAGHAATYEEMNAIAADTPPGAEGLSILPYGNGAERSLNNRNIGASFHGLDFNRHSRKHVLRAAQEGIVFALNYGLDIMRDIGMRIETVRAGHANMFLSPLFAEAFATITGARVELFDTDGSQGAARGAGVGAGIYKSFDEAFAGLNSVRTIEPSEQLRDAYHAAYARWRTALDRYID